MESLEFGIPITSNEVSTLSTHVRYLHSFHYYRSQYKIQFMRNDCEWVLSKNNTSNLNNNVILWEPNVAVVDEYFDTIRREHNLDALDEIWAIWNILIKVEAYFKYYATKVHIPWDILDIWHDQFDDYNEDHLLSIGLFGNTHVYPEVFQLCLDLKLIILTYRDVPVRLYWTQYFLPQEVSAYPINTSMYCLHVFMYEIKVQFKYSNLGGISIKNCFFYKLTIKNRIRILRWFTQLEWVVVSTDLEKLKLSFCNYGASVNYYFFCFFLFWRGDLSDWMYARVKPFRFFEPDDDTIYEYELDTFLDFSLDGTFEILEEEEYACSVNFIAYQAALLEWEKIEDPHEYVQFYLNVVSHYHFSKVKRRQIYEQDAVLWVLQYIENHPLPGERRVYRNTQQGLLTEPFYKPPVTDAEILAWESAADIEEKKFELDFMADYTITLIFGSYDIINVLHSILFSHIGRGFIFSTWCIHFIFYVIELFVYMSIWQYNDEFFLFKRVGNHKMWRGVYGCFIEDYEALYNWSSVSVKFATYQQLSGVNLTLKIMKIQIYLKKYNLASYVATQSQLSVLLSEYSSLKNDYWLGLGATRRLWSLDVKMYDIFYNICGIFLRQHLFYITSSQICVSFYPRSVNSKVRIISLLGIIRSALCFKVVKLWSNKNLIGTDSWELLSRICVDGEANLVSDIDDFTGVLIYINYKLRVQTQWHSLLNSFFVGIFFYKVLTSQRYKELHSGVTKATEHRKKILNIEEEFLKAMRGDTTVLNKNKKTKKKVSSKLFGSMSLDDDLLDDDLLDDDLLDDDLLDDDLLDDDLLDDDLLDDDLLDDDLLGDESLEVNSTVYKNNIITDDANQTNAMEFLERYEIDYDLYEDEYTFERKDTIFDELLDEVDESLTSEVFTESFIAPLVNLSDIQFLSNVVETVNLPNDWVCGDYNHGAEFYVGSNAKEDLDFFNFQKIPSTVVNNKSEYTEAEEDSVDLGDGVVITSQEYWGSGGEHFVTGDNNDFERFKILEGRYGSRWDLLSLDKLHGAKKDEYEEWREGLEQKARKPVSYEYRRYSIKAYHNYFQTYFIQALLIYNYFWAVYQDRISWDLPLIHRKDILSQHMKTIKIQAQVVPDYFDDSYDEYILQQDVNFNYIKLSNIKVVKDLWFIVSLRGVVVRRAVSEYVISWKSYRGSLKLPEVFYDCSWSADIAHNYCRTSATTNVNFDLLNDLEFASNLSSYVKYKLGNLLFLNLELVTVELVQLAQLLHSNPAKVDLVCVLNKPMCLKYTILWC